MALSSAETIQRIQEPQNKALIAKAISHEERIRFHSQTALGTDDVSSYFRQFMAKVESLLPKDKYERFCQILDFPIPTNEVVDKIFAELSNIYNAQNRHISYQFSRIEFRDDFNDFLEFMEFDQFIRKDCFEAFRNQVNSIAVVDLPAEQTSRLPEPYVYLLSVNNVIDLDILPDGNIAFITFHEAADRIVAIDDEAYRVYEAIDGDIRKLSLIGESFHGLDWCPARPLMTDNLNPANNFVKLSPITKALWALDRLLFRIVSKENLEDYAAYPIYSMYDEPCGYSDVNGNTCNSGFVGGMDRNGNKYQIKCPACKDNFYLGPGTILTSKPPRSTESPDLLNQVKITPADTQSLEYNKTAVIERIEHIINSCIGSDPGQLTGQAQNEKQVLSAYETKQAILMGWKENFEKLHKFIIDTKAALRYGVAYLGCTVDYGNKFYLATLEQLNEKLATAIKNNGSMADIDAIKTEIYEHEYRNNPEMLSRREILKRLEPFPSLSLAQLTGLQNQQLVSNEDLLIKANFVYFVNRFEDENGSITDFGILLNMSRRIEIIKNKFLEYVRETINRIPEPRQPAPIQPS